MKPPWKTVVVNGIPQKMIIDNFCPEYKHSFQAPGNKISDVIAALTEALHIYGDVPLKVYDNDGLVCPRITVNINLKKQTGRITSKYGPGDYDPTGR